MAEASGYTCPHCSAINVQLAEFCTSCGLAMPPIVPDIPRVISGRLTANTSVGQKLQADELLNTATRAARSLLSIGIIYMALGALNGYLIYSLLLRGRSVKIDSMLLLEISGAANLVVGAIYIGMYFWAKYSPLAATIVGLLVYLLKWGLDVALTVLLVRHPNGTSTYGNYGFLRILMVISLINGIGAAVKHRRLVREQHESGAPMPVLPVE